MPLENLALQEGIGNPLEQVISSNYIYLALECIFWNINHLWCVRYFNPWTGLPHTRYQFDLKTTSAQGLVPFREYEKQRLGKLSKVTKWEQKEVLCPCSDLNPITYPLCSFSRLFLIRSLAKDQNLFSTMNPQQGKAILSPGHSLRSLWTSQGGLWAQTEAPVSLLQVPTL